MSKQPDRTFVDEATLKQAYDDYFSLRKTTAQICAEFGFGGQVLRRKFKKRGWKLLLDERPRHTFTNFSASLSEYRARDFGGSREPMKSYNPDHEFVTHEGICVICDKERHG